MSKDREVRLSKTLSYHLRHAPQEIGLTLEDGGWVKITDLIAALYSRKKLTLTIYDLKAVVANCPKKRFSFSEDGLRIRANQGHSVEVDLQLEETAPPPVVYHGTADRFLDAIQAEGLKKMNRHHVHLSGDVETAHKVGSRHGRPVVLEVHSGKMHEDGFKFFRSANGVWLTDVVPAKYIGVPFRNTEKKNNGPATNPRAEGQPAS